MYGPDGYLYSTQGGSNQLVRYDAQGNEEILFDNAPCNDLVILANGHKYYTDPKNHRIWHITPSGKRSIAHEGIENPNGIIASSDQSLIYAADTKSNFVYSFQIRPDGSLAHGQPYFHMHTPPDTNVSGADGMTVDNEGNLYVATTLDFRYSIPMGDAISFCPNLRTKSSQMSFSEDRIATPSTSPAQTKSTNARSTPSEPCPGNPLWNLFAGSCSSFILVIVSRTVPHEYALERDRPLLNSKMGPIHSSQIEEFSRN